MTLKDLPLSDLFFADIIDKHFIYADKTKYIYDLLTSKERDFFLSRPRRFGKTLLLRTIEELFTTGRKWFEALWIGDSDYTFPIHPVLFLSLSMNAWTPELFESNLLKKLREIASESRLKIDQTSSADYFGSLIKALCKEYKSKVVILIDEYDAPVTRNMANIQVAEKNANILHDFFAILKDNPVSYATHFTFVTGITRYALTSMDSGGNHLTDISLDPQYAGICGFTINKEEDDSPTPSNLGHNKDNKIELEDFEPLFADRMESTLVSLKETGTMNPSDTVEDLRNKIRFWYDGYNWGGKTRVLNPYSILKFFKYKTFNRYWLQSGRPGHLTALIKSRPLDFLEPNLASFLISDDVRKSDLTSLSVVPVLFHSGYLTVDKVSKYLLTSPLDNKSDLVDSYSFKLPNFEVSSSYLKDCFQTIFDLGSDEALALKAGEMRKALLDQDAKTVSSIFSNYLATISYFQRPKEERTFHTIIQTILQVMGFKVISELTGSQVRLDLCIEMPDKLFIIIELKYCPKFGKLPKKEENSFLAFVAMEKVPEDEINRRLAREAKKKLEDPFELFPILSSATLTEIEKNRLVAEVARKSLPKDEINKILARLVKDKLSEAQLNEILEDDVGTDLSEEDIDGRLSKAADEALLSIEKKDYHSLLRNYADRFIDLGLAIYGSGSKVKAVFGKSKG